MYEFKLLILNLNLQKKFDGRKNCYFDWYLNASQLVIKIWSNTVCTLIKMLYSYIKASFYLNFNF